MMPSIVISPTGRTESCGWVAVIDGQPTRYEAEYPCTVSGSTVYVVAALGGGKRARKSITDGRTDVAG